MKTLWVTVTRPTNFEIAVAAATALKPHFDRCHLIVENKSAWQRARWRELASVFDDVTEVAHIPPPHGLGDVAGTLCASRDMLRTLRALDPGPEDQVLCFCCHSIFGNAVLTAFATQQKHLFITPRKFSDYSQPLNWSTHRWTSGGWVTAKIIEPLLGLQPSFHLKLKQGRGGDGERLRRYLKPLENLYQTIIYLTLPGENPPQNRTSNLLPCAYPAISQIPRPADAAPADENPKVVFFGTPFLALTNISPESYSATLNDCLDYLRRHYPGCRLVYRPHPAETHEREQLRLENFIYENDREAAELYFLRHAPSIRAVYSVASSVSRSALALGFDAHAFWPVFPFDGRARDFFSNVLGQVPKRFYIDSLEDAPVRAILPSGETGDFSSVLHRAVGFASPTHS